MLSRSFPYVLLAPLYIIFGIVVFWEIQTFSPPFISQNLKVVTPYVHDGDFLEVAYDTTRIRDCYYDALLYLERQNDHNERFNIQSDRFFGQKNLKEITIRRSEEIPHNLPVATYKIFTRVSHICNPMDIIFPNMTTFYFGEITVLPKDQQIP
jgi:hypothetical protein